MYKTIIVVTFFTTMNIIFKIIISRSPRLGYAGDHHAKYYTDFLNYINADKIIEINTKTSRYKRINIRVFSSDKIDFFKHVYSKSVKNEPIIC